MSQISSINFKKSFAINAEHNDRTLPPSYLIDNEKGARCDRTAEQARELKAQIINEAINTYTTRTGQKFQAKSYEWSAVVNIKPDTTMQDLERLSKHFGDKYGFQCYQIAIHRDEGHIDENGEKQINHHAHLEFITLDKQTGINNYRREKITPKVLREIQTEVAEILGMQRGADKRISKAERIEPRQYAKLKEAEKKAIKTTQRETEKEAIEAFKAVNESEEKLLSQKEKAEYLEQLRKQYKGKGLSATFFRELGAIKKDKETQYTQKELDEAIQKAIEADREKQKPINRQEFERQTEKELKAYSEAPANQKPTISPFLQSLIALMPKESDTSKEIIKRLEKELRDEKEAHYKNVETIVTGITKRLDTDTSNSQSFADMHRENLKAIDNLKSEINTLKTQNKALQEQNAPKPIPTQPQELKTPYIVRKVQNNDLVNIAENVTDINDFMKNSKIAILTVNPYRKIINIRAENIELKQDIWGKDEEIYKNSEVLQFLKRQKIETEKGELVQSPSNNDLWFIKFLKDGQDITTEVTEKFKADYRPQLQKVKIPPLKEDLQHYNNQTPQKTATPTKTNTQSKDIDW